MFGCFDQNKTFCYFCISEYDPSSQVLKFHDRVEIEYGKFNHHSSSTLNNWQIINRLLSGKNTGHRKIQVNNASGRISIISKNAICVYQIDLNINHD